MENSDIKVDASKFRPESVPKSVSDFNVGIREQTRKNPKWWEVGAAKYRQMRLNGETPFPKAVVLDGSPFEIPSRDSGRKLPCRIMKPDNGQYRTVIMHIHGGGWVLMSEEAYDPLLKFYANGAAALVISVGYRLAPEHPFPAGPDDCRDAAEWLVDNAEKEFGAPLQFVTGDSAGGHLTMVSYLHLARCRPNFRLKGLVPAYGVFDLTKLPQTFNFDDELILTEETMDHYIGVVCPGWSTAQIKDPATSPLYAKLEGLALPPTLFVCGTADVLVDDTAFMAVKWQMAGGEGMVKYYPGAPHGFLSFPDTLPVAKEAKRDILAFFNAKAG